MLGYEIDVAARLIVVRGAETDPAARLHFIETVLADPAFQPGFGILRDRRGEEPLATSQIRTDSTFVSTFPVLRHSRWAFLVDGPAELGAIHWASALATADAIQMRAFLDEAEARRWLADGAEPA